MHKRKTFTLMILALAALSLASSGQSAALQKKTGNTTTKSQGKPQGESQGKAMTKMQDDAARESPFACNVAGISAEQRPRYMALAKKLVGAKQEVRELADGYAFRFTLGPSTIQEVAEFIAYERRCCPFFDLELVVEREDGPVWLRLRGRDGVKEFIRSEFGIQ